MADIEVKRRDILETPSEVILVYRFRIRCADRGLLEMMERVVCTRQAQAIQVTTYCFHWQRADGNLIRRWDNAPHFPKLPGFPHHIHKSDALDDVISGVAISGLEVLNCIEKLQEEPLIRVMALHALAYCERLFYLEEVEEIRRADAIVLAGRRLHEDIDKGNSLILVLENPIRPFFHEAGKRKFPNRSEQLY